MEFKSRILFMNKHNTKNDMFKMHSHNCYEVVYFLTGSGKTIIGGKNYPVSAHSYCIIPPKADHIECIEGYGEILFIGFEYESSVYHLQEGVYHNSEIDKFSLFDNIFDEYKKQALGFETAADYLLKLFIITVFRNTQADDRKCKDLNYIKAYIEQHADQKINFRQLALLSGYSYDYFRHIFKKKFGISPQEYMIEIRLKNAKRLLENTNRTCTEIAYCCGFSNGAQLSAMFRKKWGVSPMDVRK